MFERFYDVDLLSVNFRIYSPRELFSKKNKDPVVCLGDRLKKSRRRCWDHFDAVFSGPPSAFELGYPIAGE